MARTWAEKCTHENGINAHDISGHGGGGDEEKEKEKKEKYLA